MAEVVADSYSSGVAVDANVGSGELLGQSFTASTGILSKLIVPGYRAGTVSGTLYAYVYAHTGTYGTSSLPTGAPLAVSDPVSVDGLQTSVSDIIFTFSGVNRIQLGSGDKHVVAVSGAGSGGNIVKLRADATSPAHSGNYVFYSGSWSALPFDTVFAIYVETLPSVQTDTTTTIESTRAVLNATPLGIGDSIIDEHGFVLSKRSLGNPGNVNPTASGYEQYVSESGIYVLDPYSLNITGLDSLTTYYVRAFMKNSTGYAYGNEVPFTTANLTTVSFLNTDPTEMFKAALDSSSGRGGTVDYDGTSTDLTGLSLDYEFTLASVLDVIKKAKDLAPSDWYWYVHPGTNIAYFKQTSTTPDHTLIIGRHIEELDFELSIEDLKNDLFFTGGDTGGGTNFFKEYKRQDSIDIYGPRIATRTDGRVTSEITALAYSDSILDEDESEATYAEVTVLRSKYDITLFNTGDTVAFQGKKGFLTEVLLQISRIDYSGVSAKLYLGKLPPRRSELVEQMKKDLLTIQTLDNPTSPS